MMAELWADAKGSTGLFQKAVAIVDKVSDGKLDRDTIRTQVIAQAIIKELAKPAA